MAFSACQSKSCQSRFREDCGTSASQSSKELLLLLLSAQPQGLHHREGECISFRSFWCRQVACWRLIKVAEEQLNAELWSAVIGPSRWFSKPLAEVPLVLQSKCQLDIATVLGTIARTAFVSNHSAPYTLKTVLTWFIVHCTPPVIAFGRHTQVQSVTAGVMSDSTRVGSTPKLHRCSLCKHVSQDTDNCMTQLSQLSGWQRLSWPGHRVQESELGR